MISFHANRHRSVPNVITFQGGGGNSKDQDLLTTQNVLPIIDVKENYLTTDIEFIVSVLLESWK